MNQLFKNVKVLRCTKCDFMKLYNPNYKFKIDNCPKDRCEGNIQIEDMLLISKKALEILFKEYTDTESDSIHKLYTEGWL